ncbi:MAG: hypothetical protein RLZ98_3155 [Pseudomonadota bacterium]|jgi:ComF family protein
MSDDSEAPAHDRRFGLRAAGALIGRGARALSDIVMPPVCLSCQRLLVDHNVLCGTCWSRISFIRPPVCDVLGLPLPFDPGGRTVSAAALAAPPDFDRARAVAAYGDVMARLIHGFKYADRHESRQLFVRWLVTVGSELLADADLIVPVPLHRWRLLTRKFNQAAILAGDISRAACIRFEPGLLRRTRNTRSQVGLTNAQRRRNTSGAFVVDHMKKARVAGRHVVLVDDVITTGSTAGACARALKRAGASRVDVLALAMVVHDLDFDL